MMVTLGIQFSGEFVSKDSINFWMEIRNVTVPKFFQTIKRIFFQMMHIDSKGFNNRTGLIIETCGL